MTSSPSSPISKICKDLHTTVIYDAELRSSMHLMSLSLNSNAYLPIQCLSTESIANDWSRVLLLERIAQKLDRFDHELYCELQQQDELPELCQPLSLSLPNQDLDHMLLDDVIFKEPCPTRIETMTATDSIKPVRTNQVNGGPNRPSEDSALALPTFMTATDKLKVDEQNKFGRKRSSGPGLTKTHIVNHKRQRPATTESELKTSAVRSSSDGEFQIPSELQGLNLPANLVESIMCEIMDKSPRVLWDDIAGLEFAKKCIREIVVWPMLRPDLFKGLRGPPKGLLLFGPPGTGKTMIGRAIASECNATFFSISASSLTSKWHGESEKLVRTLFAVARCYQPAVIFVDEIDSLLAQRSDSEFEGSRRLKTEFLIQLDGAATCKDDRLLLIGATNRPQELDEAARRRLVKRLFIPLPDADARRFLIRHLVSSESHELDNDDSRMEDLVARTKGYSGADINALCTEASYGPIRDLPDITDIRPDQVRPIAYDDFQAALAVVRASVSLSDLGQYHDWNDQFGSFTIDPNMT